MLVIFLDMYQDAESILALSQAFPVAFAFPLALTQMLKVVWYIVNSSCGDIPPPTLQSTGLLSWHLASVLLTTFIILKVYFEHLLNIYWQATKEESQRTKEVLFILLVQENE